MAYKILIVDDDKDLSFIISETLKKYSFIPTPTQALKLKNLKHLHFPLFQTSYLPSHTYRRAALHVYTMRLVRIDV